MLSLPEPMLAVSGRPPLDSGRWAFEMKWDGIRALAGCQDGNCRLHSRNNRDLSAAFPELTAALAQAGGDAVVLDGEIVAPDPKTGAPSFHRLQRRMHVNAPGTQLMREFPSQYLVFDVLATQGETLTGLPYTERRRRLDQLQLDSPLVRTPPYYTGIDPATLLDLAREHGLEGIVAKRLDSAYYPGRRCPVWIKTPLRDTTEAVIAGWIPGSGRLSALFGSLVLGAYDEQDRLVHIGNVGTGWSMRERRDLHSRLTELSRPDSPFDTPPPRAVAAAARWVSPVLVADIEYREVTPDGLRHPSWRGLRPDKTPHEAKVPVPQ